MERPTKCQVILQKCLAIRLRKNGGLQDREHNAEVQDYWMYDNGYLLFQALLQGNCKCFWNPSLLEAMQKLQFEGYVAQSTLLVRGSPCALEVVRNAWARNVLKAPTNYTIVFVGDIDDCLVTLVNQGQFTPLPEALCWVILELTSSGQHAVMESIRNCLHKTFPGMERPSAQLVYDALARLMQEKKIYQTSQGYFIVTPESRRLRPQRTSGGSASPGSRRSHRRNLNDAEPRKLPLMTTEEALTYVHGEMSTIRDGDITHQSIQTNLYDVICGGNPNDKILFPSPKRSSATLERRNSLKLFGSNKKLNSGLVRSGSMKYISHKHANLTDSSSSTDTASQSQIYQPISTKKTSFLARIFRRSGRKRGLSAPPSIQTFSAQFPPTEWFNPKVIHMHCVGTQTKAQDMRSQPIGVVDYEPMGSCRSYSVPRRSKSPHPFATKNDKNASPSPRHTPSPRRLQPDFGTDRAPRSRRSSVSKSSKSLNETRIYEEIRHQSSANLNDGIYAKLQEHKELSSTPVTPKYSRRLEKRSSSLPRRKTSSRMEPVTHTDFPYNDNYKEEVPIMPNVTARRSSSFENLTPFSGVPIVKIEDKLLPDPPHDMTSLTSSGYDTQTNSIISTSEVPYSLKVSNNYLASSSPPPSLTIVEDPSAFSQTVSLTSNGKTSVSVQVSTDNNEMTTRVNVDQARHKLERFPSLYSPREVLKTGYGYEPIDFTPVQSQDDLDKLCEMFPKIEMQKSKIPIKKIVKRPMSAVDNGLLISTTLGKDVHFPDFPSLTDLAVNFKSLAAQNILNSVNNVSVTSVDTLVEVNMAASKDEKSFVNVSTDFGIV